MICFTRPLGLLPDPYLNPAGYLIPIAPKSLKKSWIWVKKFEFLVTQRTLKSFGANYTSKCLCLQVSLYIGLIETDKWTTTEEFPFTKGTVEGWRRHKCFQTDTSNGHDFILELCQKSIYKNGLCSTFISFINVKCRFPLTYFMSFSCTDCDKKLQLICTQSSFYKTVIVVLLRTVVLLI